MIFSSDETNSYCIFHHSCTVTDNGKGVPMKLFNIFIIKKWLFTAFQKINQKNCTILQYCYLIYFCKYYFIRPWCSMLSTIKFWIFKKIVHYSWKRLKWDYIPIQVLKRQKIVKHIIGHSRRAEPQGASRCITSAPNQISDIVRHLSCPVSYCIFNARSVVSVRLIASAFANTLAVFWNEKINICSDQAWFINGGGEMVLFSNTVIQP